MGNTRERNQALTPTTHPSKGCKGVVSFVLKLEPSERQWTKDSEKVYMLTLQPFTDFISVQNVGY